MNSAGFVVARKDFLPFGEELQTGIGLRNGAQGYTAEISTRQGYGLTENDRSTGLNHTLYRKNENRAGRWTSPDPYNGSASLENPQSFNRYSYVGNQPTNFVDPTGLQQARPGTPCRIVVRDANGEEIVEYGRIDKWGNCSITDYGAAQINWSDWFSLWALSHRGFNTAQSNNDGITATDLNNIVQSCSLSSGGEYVDGVNFWKSSRNGKWYRGLSGRGPNQFTGPRSSASFNTIKVFKIINVAGFVVSTGLTIYQAAVGQISKTKAGIDITFGIIALVGGPWGFAIGATYFLVDATIGWDKVLFTGPATVNPNRCHPRGAGN